jgi:choline/ethanolamine kinase
MLTLQQQQEGAKAAAAVLEDDEHSRSDAAIARFALRTCRHWQPQTPAQDDSATTTTTMMRPLQLSDCVVSVVSGGLTNALYKVTLKPRVMSTHGCPRAVLVRFYGQGTEFMDRSLEERVVQRLGSLQLGPEIFGIRSGVGRVEQFLAGSRCLDTAELRDAGIAQSIGAELGRLHRTDMSELCSDAPASAYTAKALRQWLAQLRTMDAAAVQLPADVSAADRAAFHARLRAFDFDALSVEIEEVCAELHSGAAGPLVFSHNDLQEGNVMLRRRSSSALSSSSSQHHRVQQQQQQTQQQQQQQQHPVINFIDFEYAGYNHRGFDLGNHFCEYALNYNEGSPPYFAFTPSGWPSVDEQNRFLAAYVRGNNTSNTSNKAVAAGATSAATADIDPDLLAQLRREAFVGAKASHLLWALWSVIMGTSGSTIKFGYLQYGLRRYDSYLDLKRSEQTAADF